MLGGGVETRGLPPARLEPAAAVVFERRKLSSELGGGEAVVFHRNSWPSGDKGFCAAQGRFCSTPVVRLARL